MLKQADVEFCIERSTANQSPERLQLPAPVSSVESHFLKALPKLGIRAHQPFRQNALGAFAEEDVRVAQSSDQPFIILAGKIDALQLR